MRQDSHGEITLSKKYIRKFYIKDKPSPSNKPPPPPPLK